MTALLLAAPAVRAHGPEPRYRVPLEGRAPHTEAVYGAGRSLGLRGKGAARVTEVEGRRCLEGGVLTPRAWFDGLAAGRTFVTNGPLLELTVNGRGMGSEIAVETGRPLRIRATAAVNPDLEPLERLELVVHGEVVETARAAAGGARTLTLERVIPAAESLGLAVRALGVADGDRPPAVAHSVPVYVSVDGRPFWRTAEVPAIVAAQRRLLAELLAAPPEPRQDLELWETAEPLVRLWQDQKPQLERRVAEADARYDALLQRLRLQQRGRAAPAPSPRP